ncbi:hypothetical protein F183_A28920 [Bryobacterales bacterium F-183]|nr:hypothetical protein F183_A28920 [Bryobacterales bacterium F-183]
MTTRAPAPQQRVSDYTQQKLRGAVICDFHEERWPSMDLTADRLVQHAQPEETHITLDQIRPAMRSRLQRLPGLRSNRMALNADRLANRFLDYPRYLRAIRGKYDFFHIADHSYAHLVHSLPHERTGVYCHDLDIFRCLVDPPADPRPAWFRSMAGRVLSGLQKASIVFHSTDAVRGELMKHELVDPARLVRAPFGVSTAFHFSSQKNVAHESYLLHVGSCIPRKRMDVLLESFASARGTHPELRLIKVGGQWTSGHQAFIESKGLSSHITHLRDHISDDELATLYRGARIVLMPSSAEGFGLPVIEALACGATIIASDLPVFREIAGSKIKYCPVGSVREWTDRILELLSRPPERSTEQASAQPSWETYAGIITDAYRANDEAKRGPKRLRVLHVGKFYPPHRGGMETHLEGLSARLKDSVDLDVVVSNTSADTATAYPGGVRVTRLRSLMEVAGMSVCPGMVGTIAKSRSDIVHIHWPNPAAVLAFLLAQSKAKLVITYHSDVLRQRFLNVLFQPFLALGLRRCQAIIVTSPNYVAHSPLLSKWQGICHTVPLGIDPSTLDMPADHRAIQQIRDRFGDRLILAVGRMVAYKGLSILMHAMVAIDGTLLLAGDGPLRDDLEAEAVRLGVSDRVMFLGAVPNVVPYYHACDLFVLPSIERTEAFGLVQLEAMACGKPVVNTSLRSGVPFVSPHGVTGLTVTPGNASELAEAINTLLADRSLRDRFGEAGRHRVNRDFTLERMVSDTLHVYESLA